MDGIFISYRREDSAGYAGRLYDRLAAHFGTERVFMDVEGIALGTDFVEAIEQAVTSCKVLIVLIGRDWMEVADGAGNRRLDDPNDFIRLETSTALKRNIRVVPVLLEGAQMPREEELPEDLAALSRRQAIEVSHKQWEASTGNLIEALDRIYSADTPGGVRPATSTTGTRRWPWLVAAVAGVALAVGGWLYLYPLPDSPITRAPIRSSTEPVIASLPGSDKPPPAAAQSEPAKPAHETAPDAPQEPAVMPVREPIPVGRLEVQPSRIDYGTVTLGASSVASVTLTNSGDAEVPVATLRTEGDPADEITLDPQCPDTLQPGESCQVKLRFKPRVGGSRSHRLIIDRAGDAAIEIALTGQAVAPPVPEPPVAPEAAPARPSPEVVPEILRFTSRVTGSRAELCYEVKNARQLAITPQPGRLSNLRKDCVTVKLESPTRFKLVARGSDRSVTDSLVAAPEPVAAVSPVPAPTPAAEPEPAVDKRLPQVRDQWTYRIRGRWASTPTRTVEVAALSVKPNAVEELVSQIASDSRQTLGQRQVRGPVAYVTQSRYLGTEFSPYLAAFGGLESASEWRRIPTPDSDSFWTDWQSKGSVKGRESVTVPAGTFPAFRVEVWSSRNFSGSSTERDREPVLVRYDIWYAAGIKRYVKMVRTTTAASGLGINTDTFELLSYRQQ